MTLGLKPGENLVNQRTKDASVHEEYLRAKMMVNANQAEAIRLLNDSVARDPNFAPAWGILARAYAESLNRVPAVQRGDWDEAAPIIRDVGGKAATAAETAYRLDTNNSDAVYGYSELEMLRGRANSLARVTLVERALALDPDNPEALSTYSFMLAALGSPKQAISVSEHLLAVEPFVLQYRSANARLLIADGQSAAAVSILQGAGDFGAFILLAQAYAAQGRFSQAADSLAKLRAPDEKIKQVLNNAVRLLRGAPAVVPEADRPELGIFDWVYVYRGAPERTAQAYQMYPRAGVPLGLLYGLEFAPANSTMRKMPAFKQYIRDSGTLGYWRARGWPDLCHPVGADDFACD
jgi:predicted Zn-dependent protease